MVIDVFWRRWFVTIASELEYPVPACSVVLAPKEETSWKSRMAIERRGIEYESDRNPGLFVLVFPNNLDGG